MCVEEKQQDIRKVNKSNREAGKKIDRACGRARESVRERESERESERSRDVKGEGCVCVCIYDIIKREGGERD